MASGRRLSESQIQSAMLSGIRIAFLRVGYLVSQFVKLAHDQIEVRVIHPEGRRFMYGDYDLLLRPVDKEYHVHHLPEDAGKPVAMLYRKRHGST